MRLLQPVGKSMINNVLRKVVGSKNDREVKRMRKSVQHISALEPEFEGLDDAGLQGKTVELRSRLENGEPLDSLLPARLPWCVRQVSGSWECVISTSRWSAA